MTDKYFKSLPLMASVLLHSVIVFMIILFLSPHVNHSTQIHSPSKIIKPIHAMIINNPELSPKIQKIPPKLDFPKKEAQPTLLQLAQQKSRNQAHGTKTGQRRISLQNVSENQQYKQLNENQRIIYEYQVKILKEISAQRVPLPKDINKIIFCIYSIYLAPNGDVLSAELVQSSGNEAIDQAAKTAIYRASPLPVPSDPAQFAPFSHFSLQLMPQQLPH